jgi:hypothetical protein
MMKKAIAALAIIAGSLLVVSTTADAATPHAGATAVPHIKCC